MIEFKSLLRYKKVVRTISRESILKNKILSNRIYLLFELSLMGLIFMASVKFFKNPIKVLNFFGLGMDYHQNFVMLFVMISSLSTVLISVYIFLKLHSENFSIIGLKKDNFVREAIFGSMVGVLMAAAVILIMIILNIFQGNSINLKLQFSFIENISLFSLFNGLFLWLVYSGLKEEILFRGYLIKRTEEILGVYSNEGIIIILTSIIFGAMHVDHTFVYKLLAIFGGVIYAILYYRNKNLTSPILAHGFYNIVLQIFARLIII